MDLLSFARGLLLGFCIAAPVGPIGILCIKRSLSGGWLLGFFSGLGAATADAIYGILAASGFVLLLSRLPADFRFVLHLLAGIFLIYLGSNIFLSRPAEKALPSDTKALSLAFISTFLLTLTNPLTIISFAAMFAGCGSTSSNAASLVLGLWFGSSFWWLALSSITAIFNRKLNNEHLSWINKLSGLLISVFGIFSLALLK
ncbi:MAG: LysE family transporter [Candidatus Obscuribacterales bacterium]|nr:LysE family transporter [Candidatus Obscuribacterales bacterium]